jgi:hypothetical protein
MIGRFVFVIGVFRPIVKKTNRRDAADKNHKPFQLSLLDQF